MRNFRPAPLLALLIALCLAGFLACRAFEIAVARRLADHAPPTVPVGVLAQTQIQFATTPSGSLFLDVYRPQAAPTSTGQTQSASNTRPLPVVLFTFGGGWMSGNRHQLVDLDLLRLVGEGYAVVTADYRLSTDAIFPAQIHDVKAALRWIHTNAAREGLDAGRVAILGPSAGGHLAALAGTSIGVRSLEGLPEAHAAAPPSPVHAVVDFFGPTDLSVYRDQMIQNGYAAPRTWFLDLLVGGPVEDHPDLVQMLNPIRYVDPSDPPFLIFHGTADDIVPLAQSQMLAEALESSGVDVTFRVLEGADHGRSEIYTSDALFREIVEFLDRALAVTR